MRLLVALLLVCSMVVAVGCNRPAKYGKCQTCGYLTGHRGGDLPGQGTMCPRCNGHIYYPPHKSDEYYEYKREYGGTED